MAEPRIDYWAYGYEAFGMRRGGLMRLHVRKWPEGACPFPATKSNFPAFLEGSWIEILADWDPEPDEDDDTMANRVTAEVEAMGLHPATWSLVTSWPD